MHFKVHPKIFSQFANPRIGILVIKDANNTSNTSTLQADLAKLITSIGRQYGAENLSKVPKIAAWREAHRQFGSKPKDYPSSVEALYKRVLKGEDIKSINPLVDAYNYISLKYMLPAGGEDIDKMQGDLELTFAGEREQPVQVLGKPEAQAPKFGEVIYKDELGTICRRWNWREVERTILSPKTINAVLVLEAIHPVTDGELKQAMEELSNLVNEHCGGTVKSFVVDSPNPTAKLD